MRNNNNIQLSLIFQKKPALVFCSVCLN